MAKKPKKIKCELQYRGSFYFLVLNDDNWRSFCAEPFRQFTPALAKGLRANRTRKLILTQIETGIILERADK